MTTRDLKEYVQFFRQFLDLCLSSDWPNDETEPEVIIKALDVAYHIELSVKKMKFERNCFDKFLDILCTNQNFTHTMLQNSMNDPAKFILKKIINSDADVNLIDVAFKRFEDLYSEDRLVGALSDLMVEAASKETLLNNMLTVLPAHKVRELGTHLHLFAILECDSPEMITDTLKDCCQEMMDALVLCLVRDIESLQKDDIELVRKKIITGFTNVMICRDTSVKRFWELLFNVAKENLVEMCLKYKPLGEMAFEALGDNFKQIKNNLPQESCYIQFTESQLNSICNTIFGNASLKFEFVKYMKNNGYENCIPVLFSLNI